MTRYQPAGEFLTLEEAARHFRVSVSTLYRWCRGGRIPAFKIGRGWLIPADPLAGRPSRRSHDLHDFLARTFHARARSAGQHWLVAAGDQLDHQDLRSGVERFVLSRRRTRLGRLWWRAGPAFRAVIADKASGFDLRVETPREAVGSAEFMELVRSRLRPQADRARSTYLLVENDGGDGREDFRVVAAGHRALARVVRELRIVGLSHVLIPPELGWGEVMATALAFDGVVGRLSGRLFTARGSAVGPTWSEGSLDELDAERSLTPDPVLARDTVARRRPSL